MKLRNLLATHEILKKLSEQKMSARLAWKVNTVIEEFNTHAKRFDDIRQKLVSEDKSEEVKVQELEELLNEEVDFKGRLALDDLDAIGLELSPLEFELFSVLVEE